MALATTTSRNAPSHADVPSGADAHIARIARTTRRTRALVLAVAALAGGAILVRLGGLEGVTPQASPGVVVDAPLSPDRAGAIGAVTLRLPSTDIGLAGGENR